MIHPKSRIIYFFSIIAIIIFIYWVPLTHPPIMTDKALVYEPLEKISNVQEYLQGIKNGKIRDFQPVRDLSLWLDIKVSSIINYENFPLIVNIILQFISATLVFKIFMFYFEKRIALSLALVFLFHPAIFHVFVDIVSRKHILSFIFMCISLLTFQRIKSRSCTHSKYSVYFSISYILSALSHPINLLTPFSFVLDSKAKLQHFKKYFYLYLPILLFLPLFMLVNFNIYNSNGASQIKKIIPDHDLGLILNGVGIFFRQFIFPFKFSPYYDLINPLNLVFAFTLVFIIIFFLKKERKNTLLPLGLLLSTLSALYIKKTNVLTVIYQNYYILTPMLGFLLIMGIFLNRRNLKTQRMIIGIYLVFSIIISKYYSNLRVDELEYFYQSVEIEPECRLLQVATLASISDGDPKKINYYGYQWLNRKCNITGENILYSRTLINSILVFFQSNYSLKGKIELFKKKFVNQTDKSILISGLYMNYQKTDLINEELLKIDPFSEKSIFMTSSFLNKKLTKYCNENTKLTGCKNFLEYKKNIKDKEIIMNYRQYLWK